MVICSGDLKNMDPEVTNKGVGSLANLESSDEQFSVDEKEEAAVSHAGRTSDLKVEGPGIDASEENLSHLGDDEHMNIDPSIEDDLSKGQLVPADDLKSTDHEAENEGAVTNPANLESSHVDERNDAAASHTGRTNDLKADGPGIDASEGNLSHLGDDEQINVDLSVEDELAQEKQVLADDLKSMDHEAKNEGAGMTPANLESSHVDERKDAAASHTGKTNDLKAEGLGIDASEENFSHLGDDDYLNVDGSISDDLARGQLVSAGDLKSMDPQATNEGVGMNPTDGKSSQEQLFVAERREAATIDTGGTSDLTAEGHGVDVCGEDIRQLGDDEHMKIDDSFGDDLSQEHLASADDMKSLDPEGTNAGVSTTPANLESREQFSVVERMGAAAIDTEINDSKAEGNGVRASKENVMSIDGIGDYLAQGHLVSGDEPSRTNTSGNSVLLDKAEKNLRESEADAQENQEIMVSSELDSSNKKYSSCISDKGLLLADLRLPEEHVLVAPGETEIMDDKKIAYSREDILDGNTGVQEDEDINRHGAAEAAIEVNTISSGDRIDTGLPMECSLENQDIANAPDQDALHESMPLNANNEEAKAAAVVEIADGGSSAGHHVSLGCEVEIHRTDIARKLPDLAGGNTASHSAFIDKAEEIFREADMKENQEIIARGELDSSVTTNSSCIVDKGFIPAENELPCEFILVGAEITEDKKDTHSQEDSLRGNAFLENKDISPLGVVKEVVEVNKVSSSDHIEAGPPTEPLFMCQGAVRAPDQDAIHENTSLSVSNEEPKVETIVESSKEDGSVGNHRSRGSKVEVLSTTNPGPKSDLVGENTSLNYVEQGVAVQQTAMQVDRVDHGQNNGPLVAGNVSNGSVDAGGAATESVVSSSGFPGGKLTSGAYVSDIGSSIEVVNQAIKVENKSGKINGDNIVNCQDSEIKSIGLQLEKGKLCSGNNQADLRAQQVKVEEIASDMGQSVVSNARGMKNHKSSRIHPGFLLPRVNESKFSVSDLVWGKVRNHPWWPGQIFDPADASEKAVKHYRKGNFLVAYFGDRTFAWNDASVLKPFGLHFYQIEKQSNSETFQHAVSSALQEVSRRVELSLACSCIPRNAREKIECQIVENTGIREDSSRRYGPDKSTGLNNFNPNKLLEYISGLAQSPHCDADRLDLVIARSQLIGFCQYKGYRPPPEFIVSGELLEDDADAVDRTTPMSEDGKNVSSIKRKHNIKDSSQPRKKERNLSDLMVDNASSPDGGDDSDGKTASKTANLSSGRKRKELHSLGDGSDKRISIYAAKVSTTTPTPKPSFRIGECIQRVASQLTGSASNVKCNSDVSPQVSQSSQKEKMLILTELNSLDEMLSQLQLAACDPNKSYGFVSTISTFFSSFRNSIVSSQLPRKPGSSMGKLGGGRKKRAQQDVGAATEDFEFDDVNDSYWKDRIVQNYSEEQTLEIGANEAEECCQLAAIEPDKSLKPSRRSHSRKRYSTGNLEVDDEEPFEYVDRKKQESSPAELILNFTAGDYIPSEVNLIKMFRRFGPLREPETEVDPACGRAKVVFKRGSDAEVAYSSAGRINVFGSMPVTYQLNYSTLTSFKNTPFVISQGQDQDVMRLQII